jgi:hypothetical protein
MLCPKRISLSNPGIYCFPAELGSAFPGYPESLPVVGSRPLWSFWSRDTASLGIPERPSLPSRPAPLASPVAGERREPPDEMPDSTAPDPALFAAEAELKSEATGGCSGRGRLDWRSLTRSGFAFMSTCVLVWPCCEETMVSVWIVLRFVSIPAQNMWILRSCSGIARARAHTGRVCEKVEFNELVDGLPNSM